MLQIYERNHSFISLLLEIYGFVIYQLVEGVKEVYNNLENLHDDVDYDHLPFNVEKIKDHADNDVNWLLHYCVQLKI